ncbi:MAG: hypothetical protein ACK2T6_06345 [Anaerolineae bacterium]
MPFEKLSAAELSANPEYVQVLKSLQVGEGAKTTVKDEGVGKFTIKQRLTKAAEAAGVEIKFLRSDPDTVIVKVTGKK